MRPETVPPSLVLPTIGAGPIACHAGEGTAASAVGKIIAAGSTRSSSASSIGRYHGRRGLPCCDKSVFRPKRNQAIVCPLLCSVAVVAAPQHARGNGRKDHTP